MKITPVAAEDSGIRLDRWFSRHFPQVTQGQLQKALRGKLIRVDGKRAEANQRLEEGQQIKHPEFAEINPESAAAPLSKKKIEWVRSLILYQDEHLIAINKPSGLATQGGTGVSEHIDGLLPALQGDSPRRPKLVHRLDRDTSGVLLLARNAKAADAVMKLFAGKQAQKTYWALVSGVPNPPEGRIDAPLAKQTRGGQERMFVIASDRQEEQHQPGKARREAAGSGGRLQPKDESDAKRASTEYRVIEKLGRQLSWVELRPLTGRTHQLRVHMEYLGHPIYGDDKYGQFEDFPEGINLPWQLHLHARHLLLPDFMGRKISVTAPLPPHMKESWEMLGLSG